MTGPPGGSGLDHPRLRQAPNVRRNFMNPTINQLTRDISNIDQTDLLSAWQWKLNSTMRIILISNLGDLFLEDKTGEIYWLITDGGELKKIADNISEFETSLNDYDFVDNWFLPGLVEKLQLSGMMLKSNEVFSPQKMTVLGGTYDIDNFSPVDMSVHFQFTGVISEKIKDLPGGTRVNIKVID